MMTYELDDTEKEILLGKVVERARADLNDGRHLTEMRKQTAREKKTEPTLDECRSELREMFPHFHTDAWASGMRNQPAFVVRVRGAHFFGDRLSECMSKVRDWQGAQA